MEVQNRNVYTMHYNTTQTIYETFHCSLSPVVHIRVHIHANHRFSFVNVSKHLGRIDSSSGSIKLLVPESLQFPSIRLREQCLLDSVVRDHQTYIIVF